MSSLLRFQKELFENDGERVLFLAHCFKTGEKKKGKRDICLCLVQSTSSLSLYEIKSGSCSSTSSSTTTTMTTMMMTGAGDNPPKKKKIRPLKEMMAIDGGEPSLNDFQLIFPDKTYSYTAVNSEEKTAFLINLINVASPPTSKIEIRNFPLSDLLLQGERRLLKSLRWNNTTTTNNGYDNNSSEIEYQIMTTKESSDVLALMTKCEHAVTNADIFVDDLYKELNVLDSANIHSIMANEENIDNLMSLLETAIQHVGNLESRLNQYDDLLEHIRDSMDKMEGKTSSIEAVNMNNKKLLTVLENVINQLDLSYSHQQALMEAELGSPYKLRESIIAAKALQKALNMDIDHYLLKMTAVQDQRKRCEKWRDKFSKSISRYLNNLFIHLGNDNVEEDMQLKLTRRSKIHEELLQYAELVHWLKDMDPKSFLILQKTYRSSLSKLYERDIRHFIDQARYKISGGKYQGSTQDLSMKAKKLLGSADIDSIGGGGSEYSLSERQRFDDVLEIMLSELELVCLDEQNFSVHFFQINNKGVGKCANDEARKMMAEIFTNLESDLLQFIATYEKMDSFFTMQALVRLGKHVLSAQDTGSFLAISLGSVLIQIKRNFDKFMQSQLVSIQESRPPKKAKCGIFTFITNFESFIATTESVFKHSERRSDLNKWYTIIVAEMMNSINRLSQEHPKTPAEVIKMENFHHLHALLAQSKIQALEAAKRDAKAKYNEALNNYVIQYFGRPLEKLNVFFEGIQTLVAAGVKESEISFQLAYSKQELKKVIAIYPGREVKKGLENLYRKVERHLCEEENLIQVVWRAMQEEFIQQYKCIEDLIQRCYPGSQLALDFTINEVLEFFSDIARSH